MLTFYVFMKELTASIWYLRAVNIHKIGIWLRSNPLWITIRLGNIGNQGMQHFPTHELHISALEVGKRGSKLRPYVTIIHLE